MKILLTGAGGFLGGTLVDYILKNTQHELIIMTSKPEKFLGRESKCLTVADLESIKWDEVDVLINCAFPRNTDGVQMASGMKYVSDILVEAVKGKVGAIINISSQSVYSQMREEPVTEEGEINLQTKYATAKYACELMVNTICETIPHTNIRLASLIGAGFNQRITNNLIEQAINGKDICVVGGKQRFGFLDVRDAARGLVTLAESDSFKWCEVYNLGSFINYSLEEIAQLVCEVSGEHGIAISYEIEKTDDWQNSSVDARLFMTAFDWTPMYDFKDTLRYIYEEMRTSI